MKEIVESRVREELERRKDEIENEVKRRVDVLKRTMEKQMLIELEKRNSDEMRKLIAKEVDDELLRLIIIVLSLLLGRGKKKT